MIATPQTISTKLITETAKGSLIKVPVLLRYADGRIEFIKSPFALKNEIKAMAGSRWHGYIEGDKRKIWSVADCPRNRFQLGYLQGENVYEWFDRELVRREYERPLMPHQCDMANAGLTYHFQIWAAEMGTGKTLSAQEVMERSRVDLWYWIGPKTSLPNIRREFRKWSMDPMIRVEMMTYEALVRKVDDWKADDELPRGVIFDESSKLKTPTSQRSKAALRFADMIRAEHGFDGYVILMSGTPSPKSPIDWWSQAEIAWPGFLREGSVKALEQRLAFMADKQFDAGVFKKRIGWKDNESKCAVCGEAELEGPHELDGITDPEDYHRFEPSKNEVAFMYERLSGLVIIKHKKDCLSLPEKRYRKILCKPTASTLRVAQAIAASAPNAVTGMTLLRELSDGFQYREVKDGKTECPHCPESCGTVHEWFDPEDEDRTFRAIDMLDEALVSRLEKRKVGCPRCGGSGEVDRMKRIVREVPCPKTKALKALLEENEEVGQIVLFAGFTGSVDRVTGICRKDGWDVVRCDGRGFQITTHDGQVITNVDPLDYWADVENNPRVAFVAHPESGGMSLTLVEARTAVYWSNSFKPEYRAQSEDRIHRKGMDENLGCTIIDLVHLPTDERVLEVIRDNRRLELMTMGDFSDALREDAATSRKRWRWSMLVDRILHGDCLDIMPTILDASVDMVLADLPYGVTQNKWDQVIPFDRLWDEYRRVTKPNAAVVLTATQPFAAQLIASNPKMFRYDLIWRKNKSTGFLNANRMPLRQHESILVFYRRLPTYHPQKSCGHGPVHSFTKHTGDGTNYGRTKRGVQGGGQTDRHPTSVIDIPVVNNDSNEKIHPNQKPVELFEYLIRSFSDEGAVVLDNCIGSGTTAIACLNTGRHFIGIEQDAEFCRLANERVAQHQSSQLQDT